MTNIADKGAGASHRLRLLCDISRAFAEVALDSHELLRTVAEQIALATGDACTVRLLSADQAYLEPVAVYHSLPEIRGALEALMSQTTQSASVGIWQNVMTTRKPLRIAVSPQQLPPDASAEQIEFIRRFPARYFMAAPLVARGRAIGGISLVRFEPAEAFSDDEEAFLRELSDRAALSIDNVRLISAERAAREKAERAEAEARKELTDRQKVEATLKNTEAMFLQAQKMEAVGRLAGGVAHDLNNVLSVILSYSELMKDELPVGRPMRDDLEEIQKAGQRASALTRQLLAFSRKQVLELRVLSLNEVVLGIEKMLRRIIGDDVELTTVLHPNAHSCNIDRGQFEQVLMNLVVNARDAMPQGGKLTVETYNAFLDDEYVVHHPESTPGPHVVLAVSDTGIGMDQATQSRIFEPFFTTKSTDRGTGLGLASVYGIVKQSLGSIWVYSEPGAGTTFKIYVPQTASQPQELVVAPTIAVDTLGGDTILLADDDAQVRTVTSSILRRAGYKVLDAGNGADALLLCEQYGARIDLLLTDVVMPRMSGRVLAEQLQLLRPDMPVLYMSGYTDDAVVLHGVLQHGINYLQKPITPDSLLRKVRQVLDAKGSPPTRP